MRLLKILTQRLKDNKMILKQSRMGFPSIINDASVKSYLKCWQSNDLKQLRISISLRVKVDKQLT